MLLSPHKTITFHNTTNGGCLSSRIVTIIYYNQYCMTMNSQTLCFEARRKCGVGFIHTQLASSYANAPQKVASSPGTVGFITRDFHALIYRQYSQTNRRGLHTLFLTSKSRCMQKFSSCRCPTYCTKRTVLIRSLRRRPCRMKPTAVGFISFTTVIYDAASFCHHGFNQLMTCSLTKCILLKYVFVS